MYFASFDKGQTWLSCRAITLSKVKAQVIHQAGMQPGMPLYIGTRDSKGAIKPAYIGEMVKHRYSWREIVVMNQPLQTVK